MDSSWRIEFALHKVMISFFLGIIILSMITLGLQDVITIVFAQTKSNSSIDQNNIHDTITGILEFKGDPFYTENTKSTVSRVLDIDPLPTVEITYNGNSTIHGFPTQTIGTIVDKMDENGAVHSKGKAIILSASGKIITYTIESIGYYNPDGSFSDTGVMFFSLPFNGSEGNSKPSKGIDKPNSSIDEFNNVFGIYKKTIDPLGNGITHVWKLK